MSDTAPLLIAHAGASSPAARAVLRDLPLPSLGALLAELAPGPIERLNEDDFDTADERALAHAMDLAAPDGHIPWAALQAAQLGATPADAAWAWFTPCHLDIGMSEVLLSQPEGLRLPPDQAQALAATMAPYFAEDAIVLERFVDGHWLASGEVFCDLATASPARVIGTDLNPWMPASALLRRLQNEMQMLLYTHPVNTEREAQGQPTVNALWLSGCGSLPADARGERPPVTLVHALRDSALNEDWPAWAAAWRELDARHCAPLLKQLRAGAPVALTLCGPRALQTFRSTPRSALSRLTRLWRKPQVADVLGAL
jgi:hypothetical protein